MNDCCVGGGILLYAGGKLPYGTVLENWAGVACPNGGGGYWKLVG